ncbi:NRDE family protein [Aurantivibrio plasticivorans]
MCLILFAYHSHHDFPFVVAANRDEFYQRNTRPAHFWEDSPELLAGKDMEAGGTWLGMTRSGRFAAVTNFRDGNRTPNPQALSRGDLAREFLQSDMSAASYAEMLASKANFYNPFNLLLKDDSGMVYFNNINVETTIIEPGIYGLGNHLLNTPWPKCKIGKTALQRTLDDVNSNTSDAPERLSRYLLETLQDSTQATEEELPETGIDREREKLLSSIFISTPQYGTRCSTTIVATPEQTLFTEVNYTPDTHQPLNPLQFIIPSTQE